MEELEKEVFEASVMNMGYPIPSTFVSKVLDITLYEASKALKSLKAKGLIKPYRDAFWSNYSEQYILDSGYRLTDLAKETEEYKLAEERERKLIKEVWGV